MTNFCWVIGGTSGIGAATAGLMEDDSFYKVKVTGEDVDVRHNNELATALDSWLLDIGPTWRDEDKNGVISQMSIVYSAGINELNWLRDVDDDSYFELFDVNAFGFFRLCSALARRNLTDLRIVAVSSDAAERPMRTSLAYCSSKAALNMGVRVIAREMADKGWRVNAVAPGMTARTKMTDYIDDTVPALRMWTRQKTAQYENEQAVIKRRADPIEVAQVIKAVIDGPDYVNGSITTINGGR